ncbi:MAG: hypothetical protein KC549_12910 [Myxococcales bacterium]|nr:hypothetical protein [Myxococcales bacterium]MCB9549585.1 hypothetical protein [Myxococcales bacterium]
METCLWVEAGARLVLQVHYDTLGVRVGPDRSVVELRLANEVDAGVVGLPWFDARWPTDAGAMRIPGGEARVAHTFSARLADGPGEVGPWMDPAAGIDVHAVLPHLLRLGTRIELAIERAEGTSEPLVRIDRWDPAWQSRYTFARPVRVGPEDRLHLRCEWDNSFENQPVVNGLRRRPADVGWGEGYYGEMCAVMLYATEAADPPGHAGPSTD